MFFTKKKSVHHLKHHAAKPCCSRGAGRARTAPCCTHDLGFSSPQLRRGWDTRPIEFTIVDARGAKAKRQRNSKQRGNNPACRCVYGHSEELCRRRRIAAGFWCIGNALSSLDKGNMPSHATKANSWPNQVFAGRESGAVSHCNRWGVPAAECRTTALPLFSFFSCFFCGFVGDQILVFAFQLGLCK
jgi:hypothetical protein